MQRDYSRGSILRHILSLAIPATGSIALSGFSSLVDVFWLGRLGSEELAAASMGMSLRMVAISILMGVSIGGAALVARYVGAQDKQRANRAALQIAFLAVGTGVLIGVVGYIWAEPLLYLMGARGEVLALGVQWVRVIFAGLVLVEMLPTMNQVLYGAGNPERAFQANLVYVLVLIALEPLLIFGLGSLQGLGIRGASLARVLASGVGIAFQWYVLLAGKARVKADLHDIRLDFPMMGRVMKLAVPTGVTHLVMNLAGTLTYRVIAPFGVATIAAFGVVSKVLGFAFTLPGGVILSPRTMVGQNLGAGKPERAMRAGWSAAGLSAALAASQMVLVFILAEPILALFNANPAVIAEGSRGLLYLALPQIAYSVGDCISVALIGAGDTLAPMWIGMGSLWMVRLPLMYGLAHLLGWGPVGIWVGMGIAQVAEALAMAVWFGQGKWKLKKI